MTQPPSLGQVVVNCPVVIMAAGPAAATAWEEFIAGNGLRPSTRKLYRNRARQFLGWLESQDISLAQVTRLVVDSYLDSKATCDHERAIYLTPLRRLFDLLSAQQVIPANPTRIMPEASKARVRGSEATAAMTKGAPPTLAEMKRYVHELAFDPIEEDDEDFDAALVMLAALHFGTRRVLPLSRYTGVNPRCAVEFACRLRDSGVWTADGKTAGEWLDEDGQLAFWLDVWVATGLLERCTAPDTAGLSPSAQADSTQGG